MLTTSSYLQQKPQHSAKVIRLSHDGRGVANVDGKVTFLHGGLPNETVSFVYRKKHANYDEGQVIAVKEDPHPHRVTPDCAHFGICGGCSLQHLSSTQQIIVKQNILLEQLAHTGGITPKNVLPPLTGNTIHYRHKARLGVKYVRAKHKVLVGFREIEGRFLADIEQCHVLHPSVGQKLTSLSTLIESLSGFQTIPQIEVAVSDTETALIFRHLTPLNPEDLEKLSRFAEKEQLHIYLQPGSPDTIHKFYPNDSQTLLHYDLPKQGVRLLFHPSSFTQINSTMNQSMIDLALDLLTPKADERFLDLFCGIGNFTLPFARQCLEITGVEGVSSSVKLAKDNASHNQIHNARFYCTDLNRDFTVQAWAQGVYDKIILDPPRTGAENVVKNIARFQAKSILYISCHPATLARDAGILSKQGYQLIQAGVMDMFPHTSHVESIALFVHESA